VSRDDLALGPKIQIEVGQLVPYRNGGKGRVLVTDARTPTGSESTYPFFTKDETSGAVFSHRVDGTLGIPGGSPHDIVIGPERMNIHVRAYKDQDGTVRIVAARNEWPSTPFPHVGETTCVLEIAG
jgi:hypothetical protein